MTQRERLFAFLSGEPTDRVPIWLLFPYHRLGCYADVRNLPQYREIWELSLQTAVFLDRRSFDAPLYQPGVTREREEGVEGEEHVTRDILRFGTIRLTQEVRRNRTGARTKRFLSSEEDLDIFLQFPLQRDPAAIEAALAPQVERWRSEAAEFPAHLGAMMTALGEPVGTPYHLSNLEEFAVWSLTAPHKVQSLLDRLMERYRVIYRYLLEHEVGDVYFLVGSEMASPPLVSRATFQRWVVPYARELIALVHQYGKKVIQHYHGQIREILPDFLTMGADALHTVEAPPTGDCTLTEAFAVVGDRLGLIGNIQYDEFRRLTPEEMDAAVCQVIEECRGKRFMLSPTAGPYEREITKRVQQNYLQFLHSGWEYGRGAGFVGRS
ncbi:MAG: uroporphyrinogen decarboxylase family protein [Armatimonadota bacterium]|nr:uroporphyrinogen decarboxylase family protein [Armatimonadota bacterium]